MSKVTGYRETAAAIRKLARFPRGVVGKASQKALRPMVAQARANLRANAHHSRYGKGVLARSLRVKMLKSTSSMTQYVVAPSGRGIGRAHLIEFGVAPHFQPKRGRMHPGHQAWPFLTPAFEQKADDAFRIMAQEIGTGMIRYAAQVAYKGR